MIAVGVYSDHTLRSLLIGDLETLEMRDTKGLYSQYKAGKLSNVVGKDIVLDPPVKSDFIIQNRYSLEEFLMRGRGIFDEIMTNGL